MRVRSEIWVSAYVRRVGGEGAFAYVARRGDADAGAIFIQVDDGNGVTLFTPAPSWMDEDGDRLWQCHRAGPSLDHNQVRTILDREVSMDPDIWIVDIEDREGRCFLDNRLIATGEG